MRGFEADGALHPRLRLKAEHSARVADEARKLALELGWPGDEVRTAEMLGLLHDVGRFSQFREFGTFYDAEGVNHGERGSEVLAEEAVLARCDPKDRSRILDGVRHHNARMLPGHLDEDSKRLLKLVREADKLDLFEVFLDAVAAGELRQVCDVERLDLEGGPSPEVLECLRRRRAVPNEAVRSLADLLLWQVGWVYDINYAPTMRRLREKRVLEKIQAHLPESRQVVEAVALAAEFRDGVLSER